MTSPVPWSSPQRASYDVIIIGGAAVGSACAWFLSSTDDFNGSVLVIERDPAYTCASTTLSLSGVRHQFSDALNVQISMFASEFITDFSEWLGDDAPDLNLHQHGYLIMAQPQHEHIMRRSHSVQQQCGAHTRLLSPQEAKSQFPFINTDGLSLFSWNPRGEGWFDGIAMMQTMKSKARQNGVEYLHNEAIGISRRGNQVTAVKLVSGENISCGQLINAAGPRAAKIAGFAGLSIPVEARKRSVFVFSCHTPIEHKMPMINDPSGVYCRPEGANFITGISPTPDPAVAYDDFAVRHHEFEEVLWPALAHRIPQFEAIKEINSWAGHYAYNVFDQNAVIGRHPEVTNFLFANGFSGHGLQQSPAVGRGISELISYDEYRSLDLAPLSFDRIIKNQPLIENAII